MRNHVTVSDEIQCKLNLHSTIHWSAKESVTITGKLSIQSIPVTQLEPALTRIVFRFPLAFELLRFYCRYLFLCLYLLAVMEDWKSARVFYLPQHCSTAKYARLWTYLLFMLYQEVGTVFRSFVILVFSVHFPFFDSSIFPSKIPPVFSIDFPPNVSKFERVLCKFHNTGSDYNPIITSVRISGLQRTKLLILLR